MASMCFSCMLQKLTASFATPTVEISVAGHDFLVELVYWFCLLVFKPRKHPSVEAGSGRACSNRAFIRKMLVTARADFLEQTSPLGEGHGDSDTVHPELRLLAFHSPCSWKH